MTYIVTFFNMATRKFKMIHVALIVAGIIFLLACTEINNLNIFHSWVYIMIYPRHILCFTVVFILKFETK